MLTYVVRRILYSVPVLVMASFLMFVSVRLTFDPTEKLANLRDASARERFKERFGLNAPIPLQYLRWLRNLLTGDWGVSTRTEGAVWPLLTRAFGFTLQLVIWGILVSAIIAVSIGIFSAIRQYSLPDYVLTGASYVGVAMPPFWFGLIATQFLVFTISDWFGLRTHLFYFLGLHSTGKSGINLDYARHLVLPVMTLTVQLIARWSRFQRASMLDVLGSDYVRTARAKGVPRSKVVMRHALRNALIPLVTVMAVDIGGLFGGLVITENIFSVPGMGRLFLISLQTGDAYTLMAWLLVTAIFVIVFNLLADVLYAVLDPRIRLS